MTQIPTSIKRRKPATTSIHEKQPTLKDKMLEVGSWFLLFLAVLVLFFGGYATYNKITQAKIAHVEIMGVDATAQDHMFEYLREDFTGGYFTTDLEVIRDKALQLSWVERVVIQRSWPDRVIVKITPRHPIAKWGTGRFLSDAGVVFQPVQRVNTSNLPLLHGPLSQSRLMMTKYRDINHMFAPLGLRLKELYLTERMTWFMQFDNGLRLIVDQDQTMSKLQRLSDLSQSDLHLVWSQIAAIDLRYRNGLAIQWKNARPPKILNGQFVVTSNEVNATENTGITP